MAEVQWGWHPLTDEWAERVVDNAHVRPGELVLDLGAGNGALTDHLVRAGARVVAVELHPRRCAALSARFADPPVRVVHADILRLPPPRHAFRVVANPPYHLTADMLRLLLARDGALVAADLVLQRAVVRRFAGGDGPARWYNRWSFGQGLSLPRSAFRRRPTVDSAVLQIRRRQGVARRR